METFLKLRVQELADYIIIHHATVRSTAKKFGISKSTVFTDVTERLPTLNPELFDKVRLILDENKAQRHIRGGIATKKKYEHLQQIKK